MYICISKLFTMPEGPELRIMRDFINQASNDRIFEKVAKVSSSKVTTDLSGWANFSLSAQSRGKELKVTLSTPERSSDLMFFMGMSGNWYLGSQGKTLPHTHVKFYLPEKQFLGFEDARRFGKWKWGSWSENRGPDIIDEFPQFCSNVFNNLDQKVFSKPLHVALMDQTYFNGIGNYLRAEIIYRADVDPFVSARNILQKYPAFLELMLKIYTESYYLGGAVMQHWNNPNVEDQKAAAQIFSDWKRCYKNPQMANFEDSIKRVFWCDPKWIR